MTKKNLFILLIFVILKFLLQYFLISPEYDLHQDEYLHLDQAHHLAWGYLSVPPVTSWISYLIYILGNSVFWIKFFPALFGALTIVIVWKTVEELNGNLFALILSATCVLFSALLVTNTLYQPNSFDVLSWTTFYFILIKYLKTENPKWLYIAALVFGIGFLNKYNIIFLVIGLLPAILLTRNRKMFVKKELYLAIILGLAIIFPNLVWQYKNDFPVFQHLNELADTQLIHIDRLDFLKDQILFFIGSLPCIIAALYALLFYKPFEKYKLFFGIIIFTLTVFIYFKAKNYYAMGLYPVFIAFGSVFFGNILKTAWKRYLLRSGLMILPLLFFMLMYHHFEFPNRTPEYITSHLSKHQKFNRYRWEDGKDHTFRQDFANMLGWAALAAKVDSVCLSLPDIEHTFILCDDYGQAGAINYHTKNNKIVAHSYQADYINWISFDKKIANVILVKEAIYDRDKNRQKEIPLFDTVYLAAQRINQYAREDTISIYVLKGAKVDVNELIRSDVNKRKNNN
jgi:hypothetical protein